MSQPSPPDPPAGAAIVVDSSAVVAILQREPSAAALTAALDRADVRVISAASLVEASLVMEGRRGPAAVGVAERFVRDAGIDVVAVDSDQAARAVEGWRRYGKGRHPAGLNYGDCFTYALAVTIGFPVLCVGSDFARTHIPVLPEREG